MARYEATNMRRVNKSIRIGEKSRTFLKYDTTLYGKVLERNSDIYVITQVGDRLDNLAFQFYGDPSLWWFIAQTNNIKTMNVPSGTSLRISMNVEFAKGT